jgi:hypothetical protein
MALADLCIVIPRQACGFGKRKNMLATVMPHRYNSRPTAKAVWFLTPV